MNCLGLGEIEMEEEFKTFLTKKEISVDEYKGLTGELKVRLVEAFEKSKPQSKLSDSFMLCFYFVEILILFLLTCSSLFWLPF